MREEELRNYLTAIAQNSRIIAEEILKTNKYLSSVLEEAELEPENIPEPEPEELPPLPPKKKKKLFNIKIKDDNTDTETEV